MLRRDHADDIRDDRQRQTARNSAPETTRLALLLWSFAEHNAGDKYEDAALIAGLVDTWADEGHNITAKEAVQAVGAALRAIGVPVPKEDLKP